MVAMAAARPVFFASCSLLAPVAVPLGSKPAPRFEPPQDSEVQSRTAFLGTQINPEPPTPPTKRRWLPMEAAPFRRVAPMEAPPLRWVASHGGRTIPLGGLPWKPRHSAGWPPMETKHFPLGGLPWRPNNFRWAPPMEAETNPLGAPLWRLTFFRWVAPHGGRKNPLGASHGGPTIALKASHGGPTIPILYTPHRINIQNVGGPSGHM